MFRFGDFQLPSPGVSTFSAAEENILSGGVFKMAAYTASVNQNKLVQRVFGLTWFCFCWFVF